MFGWFASSIIMVAAFALAIRTYDVLDRAGEDRILWQVLVAPGLPCILALLILAVTEHISPETPARIRMPYLALGLLLMTACLYLSLYSFTLGEDSVVNALNALLLVTPVGLLALVLVAPFTGPKESGPSYVQPTLVAIGVLAVVGTIWLAFRAAEGDSRFAPPVWRFLQILSLGLGFSLIAVAASQRGEAGNRLLALCFWGAVGVIVTSAAVGVQQADADSEPVWVFLNIFTVSFGLALVTLLLVEPRLGGVGSVAALLVVVAGFALAGKSAHTYHDLRGGSYGTSELWLAISLGLRPIAIGCLAFVIREYNRQDPHEEQPSVLPTDSAAPELSRG